MSQENNKFGEYLKPTKLCNINHPTVLTKAAEITNGATTQKEVAVRIFYWVRDNIKFGLYFSQTRASTTLQKRLGECINKTNLHAALLRASGIPARFHYVLCKKQVLESIISKFIYNNIGAEASHFWCECHLDGRWISCESFFDKPLYDGMCQINPGFDRLVPSIDWDGQTDLVVSKPWITIDRGSLSSADEAMDVLNLSEEGMLPPFLERLAWPIFYLSARKSDKIRLFKPSIVRERVS